jgi:hypothetical protein
MITRIIRTKSAVKVGKRGSVTQTWPLPTASTRDPFTDDIIQTKSKSWSDIRKDFGRTTMQTCNSCLYWNFQQQTKYDVDPRQCRRNPPAWRATSQPLPNVWFSAFPETFGDSWCGCWKQRKKPDHKIKKVRR